MYGSYSGGQARTEWSDYYEETNYEAEAASHKQELVEEILEAVAPDERLGSWEPMSVVTVDWRPTERVLHSGLRRGPGGGRSQLSRGAEATGVESHTSGSRPDQPFTRDWDGLMRSAVRLADRGPVDLVLGVGSGSSPGHLQQCAARAHCGVCAAVWAGICSHRVRAQDGFAGPATVLAMRADIFSGYYTREGFEAAFEKFFRIERCEEIQRLRAGPLSDATACP